MDNAHGRASLLDKGDIDGEVPALVDKLLGAVEGVHQPEHAAGKIGHAPGSLAFLCKDRDVRRQIGKALEDDCFCGLIRFRHRGAVRLHFKIEILIIDGEDLVPRFAGDFYNSLHQGGAVKAHAVIQKRD